MLHTGSLFIAPNTNYVINLFFNEGKQALLQGALLSQDPNKAFGFFYFFFSIFFY